MLFTKHVGEGRRALPVAPSCLIPAGLLLATLLLPGCRCGEESSRKRKPPAARSAKGSAPARTGREGGHVLRSLIKEAGRAELSIRGPLINLGSPDQHKYLLDTRVTGWSSGGGDKGATYAVAKNNATIRLRDWRGGMVAAVLKIKAGTPGTVLELLSGGRSVGKSTLKSEWQVVEFPFPQQTRPDRMTLKLRLGLNSDRGKGKDKAKVRVEPVQVQWVWLRRSGERPPSPGKVAVRTFGRPLRSLVADPPRTYSYYLEVPRSAALVFDYAAGRETQFTVEIKADGKKKEPLFAAKSTRKWQRGRVDLKAYAGRMVRLDLSSSGAGKSGTAPVEAGWGDPALVRAGDSPPPARSIRGEGARNLVYVLVDAARQDVYRAFNPQAPLDTPAVSRLAAWGTLFTRAYANANWTLPSVASIMTGRYPHQLGAGKELLRVSDQIPLLPEHLKEAGFTTAAFAANTFISCPFGLCRGWDLLRNYSTEGLADHAEQVFLDALEWLKKRDRKERFFLYLHTMDPHDPYRPNPFTAPQVKGGYRGKLKGRHFDNEMLERFKGGELKLDAADRRYVRALYQGEVAFHDHYLLGFLKALEAEGLLKDTLLVYSNDHGEEMWDHGSLDHGETLYEEIVRSPLILSYPPVFPPGKRVKGLVELVDLLPTLLEVLEVPAMRGTHGVSLRGAMAGGQDQGWPYVLLGGSGVGVRAGRYKLTWSPRESNLFDLKMDPKERVNLGGRRPVARRTCEVYLGESLAVPNKRRRLDGMDARQKKSGKKVVLDERLQQQLKALGYIE